MSPLLNQSQCLVLLPLLWITQESFGEPRVPIDQPNAMLPGRLPPLTATDTNLLVNDWDPGLRGSG